MVDLVKIRKKAKKAQATEQVADRSAQVAEEVSGLPEPEPVAEAEPLIAQHSSLSTKKLDKFKEEAGKRRELVATTEIATTAEQLEVLTFVISGEHYAVDIERIVEIVTPRPITRVPNADMAIVGIISLRGTIVTLLNVRSRLRHRGEETQSADKRIIVIEHHSEPVGFEVDRVLRVVKIGAGEVESHPVVHASE